SNDLYTVPGSFISMYGYERSVPYPNGHRNVIWTKRGFRTLPLPKPVAAQMKKDTARLYDYLRETGGICTLHTSPSDQGTDWADAVRRAVQGLPRLLRGARRPQGHRRQARAHPRQVRAGRLRVAGPDQGLPPRLPVLQRPHLDTRQLRLRPGGGVFARRAGRRH